MAKQKLERRGTMCTDDLNQTVLDILSQFGENGIPCLSYVSCHDEILIQVPVAYTEQVVAHARTNHFNTRAKNGN